MAGGALSFREDPFRLTPDRRYIFETDGFRRAFTMLLAGVRARRGAMLLTGPSGTGKTTLLQGLLAKLQQDGATVFWRFHPDIPGYDLLGSCLAELDVKDAPNEPAARAQALAAALKERAPRQPAVLIVDEAGQFADAQLADLAALPAATGNAVQIILAGLPGIAERLECDALAILRNVIALRADLAPLDRSEIAAYIAHRCRVAGQAGQLVFEPEAVARVFDHTGGTPRLVNRLCATALFFAAPGSNQVSAAVVDEAARACASEAPGSRDRGPEVSAAPAAREVPEPRGAEPERTAAREAATEVHRTLAEAERAWIAGAGASPAPEAPAAAAVEPQASLIRSSREKNAEWTIDASEITEEETPPPRKRSPALRIAASVAIVVGATAALGIVLWPTRIGRDYLAETVPAKAIAQLFVHKPHASALPPPAVVASPVPPEPLPASPIMPPPAEPKALASLEMPPPAIVATVTVGEPPLREPPAPTTENVAAPTPDASETMPAIATGLANIEPANGPTPAAEGLPPRAPDAVTTMAMPTEPEPAPAAIAALGLPFPPDEPPAAAPVAPVSERPAPSAELPMPAAGAAAVSPSSPTEPRAVAAVAPMSEAEAPATAAAEPAPPVVAAIVPASPSEPPPAEPITTVPAPPAPMAALTPPAPPPAASRVAQASAPAADPAELQQLMVRGDEMLRLGDPASARLFYERAAARGLARAYTAVGRTYDPLVLQRLNIRGGGANGEQALAWYRRGTEAGDRDAAKATDDLAAWMARPR